MDSKWFQSQIAMNRMIFIEIKERQNVGKYKMASPI